MRHLIFPISALFLLISCEKEIPLDKEESAPRIVVNGIFSAGDSIRVQITQSRDILYEETLPSLPDATAQLFDAANNLLGTFTHLNGEYYQLESFVPSANSSYTIRVTHPNFNEVSATSYVPKIVSINAIDTLRKGDKMSYEIKFLDDPSVTNYYAITLTKLSYYLDDLTGDTIFYAEEYFTTPEIYVQNGSSDIDGSKWGNIFLFSDASFNGQSCSFTAQHDKAVWEDTVIAIVSLRSISEDYYKYSLTIDKYLQTQGSPFAQPVQVHSNVENGFGIFGAYSVYSDTLIIP